MHFFIAKVGESPHLSVRLKQAMTKIPNILTVGAVVLAAAGHQASAQSSVRLFKDDLAQKIGNKTNGAAAKSISRTIKKFVRRDVGKSVAFARIGNRSLKKLVRNNLRGAAALTILKGTARGFIGANGNLDRSFNRFVRLVIRKLPNSEKTPGVMLPIADRLVRVNLSRGGSSAQSQFIRDLVYTSAGLVPPMS
jgi:hypothetical protein